MPSNKLPPEASHLDERIAAIKRDAEASPYRYSNALKEAAAQLTWETMDARGLSQAELARRLGKSRAYVSKVLAGGQNLTLESLAQLGEALECEWSISLRPLQAATPSSQRADKKSL